MPRDESWREPLEAREGLVTLGVLTQDEAMRAVFDSLPRITEARLLADRVIAGLGERAHHDVMAGPGNRLIFLRDSEDPRLILPEAFLALDLNVAPPPPLTGLPRENKIHLQGAIDGSAHSRSHRNCSDLPRSLRRPSASRLLLRNRSGHVDSRRHG